jgi:hypothetical protein
VKIVFSAFGDCAFNLGHQCFRVINYHTFVAGAQLTISEVVA